MNNLPQLLVLVGPTACGKTALSLELAQKFSCEIISADSMQVYRDMNIGSAKLMPDQRRGIPHHLLDVVDADYRFNVADFHHLANQVISDIIGRGYLPLVCGGTGLYVNSLIYPYNFQDQSKSDLEIRQRLTAEFDNNGGSAMHQRLCAIDPAAAARIHPNDSRRIIRALEVYEVTGKSISEWQQHNQPVKYDMLILGLTAERELLYKRIEERVDQMMEQGLLREVKELMEKGLSRGAVSMQGLGYKQLAAYLENECTLDEALYLIKRDTRRFAKRQLTWFKRDQRIKWFSIDQYPEEGELVNAAFSWVSKNLKGV